MVDRTKVIIGNSMNDCHVVSYMECKLMAKIALFSRSQSLPVVSDDKVEKQFGSSSSFY